MTNTATGEVTSFTYDADGRRVMRDTVTDTIVYAGSHYEVWFEEGDKPEDLDGDCLITVVDIMQVVARWNTSVGDPDYDLVYDLDSDGDIDIVDIVLVPVLSLVLNSSKGCRSVCSATAGDETAQAGLITCDCGKPSGRFTGGFLLEWARLWYNKGDFSQSHGKDEV